MTLQNGEKFPKIYKLGNKTGIKKTLTPGKHTARSNQLKSINKTIQRNRKLGGY